MLKIAIKCIKQHGLQNYVPIILTLNGNGEKVKHDRGRAVSDMEFIYGSKPNKASLFKY